MSNIWSLSRVFHNENVAILLMSSEVTYTYMRYVFETEIDVGIDAMSYFRVRLCGRLPSARFAVPPFTLIDRSMFKALSPTKEKGGRGAAGMVARTVVCM